jgi:hypothetical protein
MDPTAHIIMKKVYFSLVCWFLLWCPIFSLGQGKFTPLHPKIVKQNYYMLGEPKSGTTWFSVIIKSIYELEPNVTKTFAIGRDHEGSSIINYKAINGAFYGQTLMDNKHQIPYVYEDLIPVTGKSPHGKRRCQHGNTVASHAPCYLGDFIYPKSFTGVEAESLKVCAKECINYHYIAATRQTKYLQIVRDPRDVAVSQCLALIVTKAHKGETLAECVKKHYVFVLPWIKYRELLNLNLNNPDTNFVSCYEELSSHDEIVKGHAFRVLVDYLGFGDSMGPDSSSGSVSNSGNAKGEKLLNRIKESVTLSRMKGSSGPIKYMGQAKIHSGGELRYFNYFNETHSPNLLKWMDEQYAAVERVFPSPCAAFR